MKSLAYRLRRNAKKRKKSLLNLGKYCWYCSAVNVPLTIDHVVPVSLYNIYRQPSMLNYNNLVLCCQSCNQSKGNKQILDFMFDI